jgi:hypothetical protein
VSEYKYSGLGGAFLKKRQCLLPRESVRPPLIPNSHIDGHQTLRKPSFNPPSGRPLSTLILANPPTLAASPLSLLRCAVKPQQLLLLCLGRPDIIRSQLELASHPYPIPPILHRCYKQALHLARNTQPYLPSLSYIANPRTRSCICSSTSRNHGRRRPAAASDMEVHPVSLSVSPVCSLILHTLTLVPCLVPGHLTTVAHPARAAVERHCPPHRSQSRLDDSIATRPWLTLDVQVLW